MSPLTPKRRELISKITKLKSKRQLSHIDFISDMNEWQFEVYDAFRSRFRIDELKDGSVANDNYNIFLDNPDDEVARLLVSVDLHSWRPAGVGIFAELVTIHQSRNDYVIITAIKKASTIGTRAFKAEYNPSFKVTPKSILETVLKEDFNIALSVKDTDTTKVYDALREEDDN